MNKRILDTLAAIFALPSALLLIALVLPASWSIISGASDPSGWGAIGMFFLIAVAFGLLSTLCQQAAKGAGAPPRAATTPAPPDHSGGTRERSMYMSALKAGLIDGDADSYLAGDNLWAAEGMLHSYEDKDVDWYSLWGSAAHIRNGVPPYAQRPYWTPTGPAGRWVPHSVLAFWGAESRLRVARDARTDELALEMISEDPDSGVRFTAAARL